MSQCQTKHVHGSSRLGHTDRFHGLVRLVFIAHNIAVAPMNAAVYLQYHGHVVHKSS